MSARAITRHAIVGLCQTRPLDTHHGPEDRGGHPRTDPARRVVAFIRSRLAEPLTIGCIASACGISQRTLYRAVLREYGLSPMALLRRERLAQARNELRLPTAATTVTRVALHWGFDHLGRFARYYALHFGESPSDTLRRARASVPTGRRPQVEAAREHAA